MACGKTIKGLAASCVSSLGGVKNVWLASYTEGKITVDESTEVATIDTAFITASNFYKYYFKKNTASMTSTFTIDPANGVNYVSTDLTLVFSRQDAAKRLEVQSLALSDLIAVVEDANGEFWILGSENPVAMTAGTGQTGTAKTDGNNYNITLNDECSKLPYRLDKASEDKIKTIDYPVGE